MSDGDRAENTQMPPAQGREERGVVTDVVIPLASPLIGAAAGAAASHYLQNRPPKEPPPPKIELPPGVERD